VTADKDEDNDDGDDNDHKIFISLDLLCRWALFLFSSSGLLKRKMMMM